MIRLALKNDMNSIMQIVDESKLATDKYKAICWEVKYPNREMLVLDIKEKNLFVQEIERRILGFICVNNKEEDGYESIDWTYEDNFIVLHRILVDRRIRQSGVGKMLMKFSEELAKEKGVKSIRGDIYSLNGNAQKFITSCGYKKVGEIFRTGIENSFYCYEKII